MYFNEWLLREGEGKEGEGGGECGGNEQGRLAGHVLGFGGVNTGSRVQASAGVPFLTIKI